MSGCGAGIYVIDRSYPDGNGGWVRCQLTFKADDVLAQLARKALKAKGKKATAMKGNVTLKVLL